MHIFLCELTRIVERELSVDYSAAYFDARNSTGRAAEKRQPGRRRERRRDGVYVRPPVFTLRTNMDDAIEEPEKKNCTFLFKRRKIRSNATRKRKGTDDDGELSLVNINLNTRYLEIPHLP